MSFDEYDIVQNSGLCAVTLQRFVIEYVKSHSDRCGPPLPLCLCILPIALHDETSSSLWRRWREGGLFNARTADRTLGVGLQERIMDMREMSLEAMRLGFKTGLIAYSVETGTIGTGKLSALNYRPSKSVNRILMTAGRLGYWFATRPLAETCGLLRISL